MDDNFASVIDDRPWLQRTMDRWFVERPDIEGEFAGATKVWFGWRGRLAILLGYPVTVEIRGDNGEAACEAAQMLDFCTISSRISQKYRSRR